MEIMELSHEMESLDIVKTGNSFRSVLKKALRSRMPSPRITRSQAFLKEEPLEIPTSVLDSPRTNRRPRDPEEEIKKIYLNKKVKLVHKSLETIYEDPITKKGNMLFLGPSKVKRSIYLDREFRTTTKQKSKLRKIKIKRLGTKMKKCKLSDDEFKKKMITVDSFINDEEDDSDSDSNSTNEVISNEYEVVVLE